MNNETNSDRQVFECHFFEGPNRQPLETAPTAAGETVNPAGPPPENSRVEEMEWEELDPLDSEEIDVFYPESQPLALGEIPTVKDRFESLLRDRLRMEIQQKPPLFPWETEWVADAIYPDVLNEVGVPDPSWWTAQREHFKWSAFLPETVFAQLLAPCQKMLHSALQDGAKLVGAVQTFFPEDPRGLNEWAGRLMLGEVRDPELQNLQLPAYEVATEKQKMVLLLLAAREIIDTLTLTCFWNRAPVSQEWRTTLGVLNLEVEYSSRDYGNCLRILAQLPAGGCLQFKSDRVETTARRAEAGYLNMELVDPQPDRIYRLNVLFHDAEQNPLCFAILPRIEA
jgi:hypothetical protein